MNVHALSNQNHLKPPVDPTTQSYDKFSIFKYLNLGLPGWDLNEGYFYHLGPL